MSSEQNAGISGIDSYANAAQPYINDAAGTLVGAQSQTQPYNVAAYNTLASAEAGTNPYNTAAAYGTAASASPLTGQQINNYLSPYLSDVMGSTSQLLSQENQQAQAGQLGNAISSGAFGGDRTGIAAANLNQQQELANANVLSGIANQGYQSALSTAQGQQQIGLQGAQQLANIGQTAYGEGANTAAQYASLGQTNYGEGANTANALAGLGTTSQTAGLQGAQAQLGAGSLEQNTQQAEDTALYNQFEQQQSFPYQVDQFLANIAEGTGALSGSTTTTTQPGGFFSDDRLKHSKRPIGKTFDGQTIYAYQMHGDPRTRMGLIAQEVERKHPGAVGVAQGYKMVDYGKATEKAANRGHFGDGGVVPFRAKRAAGGGTDLDAILAAQQQMYAGLGGAKMRGINGMPRGGAANVPAPSGGSPQLMTAQGGLQARPTGMQNTAALGQAAKNYEGLYKDLGGTSPSTWFGGSTTTTTTPGGLSPGLANAQANPSVSGADLGTLDQQSYSQPVALVTNAPDSERRGGRIHRDAGGDTPYSDDGGLVIPDENPHNTLSKPAALPPSPTGFQQLMQGVGAVADAVLVAAKRGGRIGKGGGGGLGDDPDLQPIETTAQYVSDPTITATPSGGADYAMGEQVVQPSRGVAAAAEPVTYSGGAGLVAPPSPDPDTPKKVAVDSGTPLWDTLKTELAKPSNIIPIIAGIGAMGTAPTRSLGVALASGLSGAAQSYVPTQQGLAQAQGQQIQNQMMGLRAKAMGDYFNNSGSASSTPPPTRTYTPPKIPDGATAGDIDQAYRNTYAVAPPGALPQERAQMDAAQNQSYVLGSQMPVLKAKQDQQNRYNADLFASQQAAQQEAAALYPAVAAGDKAATIRYNALFPHTGDKYIDLAGREVNSRNFTPAVGAAAQQLTPQQQLELAKPVHYGAPQDVPLAKYAADNGVPLPPSAVPANAAASDAVTPVRQNPTMTAPPVVPTKPKGNAVPTAGGAPIEPMYLAPPRIPATTVQTPEDIKKGEQPIEARKELLDDMKVMSTAAQEGLTYTNAAQAILDSHGNIAGLGSNAKAQVSRALQAAGITEGVNATNYQELAKQLGNIAVQNFKTNFGARPAAKEFDIQMGELNPNPDMTPDAIKHLLNFNAKKFDYAIQTGHRAVEYTSKGGDPIPFFDWNNSHFPQTTAINAPVRPGQQTSGPKTIVRTGTLNGRKVVQYADGTTAYGD